MTKQIKLQDFDELVRITQDIYKYSIFSGFSLRIGGRNYTYAGVALYRAWEILSYTDGQTIRGDSVIQFLNLAEVLQMELESTNG